MFCEDGGMHDLFKNVASTRQAQNSVVTYHGEYSEPTWSWCCHQFSINVQAFHSSAPGFVGLAIHLHPLCQKT